MIQISSMKKFTAFILAVILICYGFIVFCGNSDNSFTTYGAQDNESYAATDSAAPKVYMTTDISPKGLMAVYEKLGFQPKGNVAVKLSTGEAGNTHYLAPNLIKELVQSVDGTIVECNTAYGGSRSRTALHRQVIEDHGFNAIADVDIMDEDGSMPIPVENGQNIHEDYVGTHLADYDSMLVLSHFKGHAMAGYGGAIKNMSIGIASSEGKNWIHSAGTSKTSSWGGDQDGFLESMAEATDGVIDYFDGKIVYINVMNHLSVDCDCDGSPAAPELNDIGILASTDPVALDQACIDLVYARRNEGAASLISRIESRNGLHTLEYAQEIGLGSRNYNIVDIDSTTDQKLVYGDANNSGYLDKNDAEMILQKVLNNSFKTKIETVTNNYKMYLDVDNDGILTATDAAIVMCKVLNSSYKMPVEEEAEMPQENKEIKLFVGEKELPVQWEDNESVEALKELIKDKPLSIKMSMYGGFEQVGSLGTNLPRNDVQTVTEPGDIVLYSGNQIVIFYGSNSWAYTKLGKVINTSANDMKELLGNGDVTITLSMSKYE